MISSVWKKYLPSWITKIVLYQPTSTFWYTSTSRKFYYHKVFPKSHEYSSYVMIFELTPGFISKMYFWYYYTIIYRITSEYVPIEVMMSDLSLNWKCFVFDLLEFLIIESYLLLVCLKSCLYLFYKHDFYMTFLTRLSLFENVHYLNICYCFYHYLKRVQHFIFSLHLTSKFCRFSPSALLLSAFSHLGNLQFDCFDLKNLV